MVEEIFLQIGIALGVRIEPFELKGAQIQFLQI